MKKNYIRQSIGIDVSKDTLDIAISAMDPDFNPHILATHKYNNDKPGLKELIFWIERKRIKELPLKIVMEATGIYHEKLAHTLADNDYQLAIVMPNKIKNFCATTNIRSVTDKISAKQIAEFGLIKKLDNWQKPNPLISHLKTLTRERSTLLEEKTIVSNQRHAYKNMADIRKETLLRFDKRIKVIDKQIAEIEKEIKQLLTDEKSAWLKAKIDKICTIRGLGESSVVTVIAETDGFNLIRNSRQLVCYAGYDVVHKESGTSVKKQTRMSHKGNRYIRKVLYYPALSAKMHEPYFTDMYNRLYAKQQVKMKTYVAIQRKLLILIYTLWKKDMAYDPNYHKKLATVV
ncbi:MAG TPA: IS110 family transposase [Chitinispirillaceae bacterium]|nr:IS110 family transposase [Chitinispirillaceae bacterium]